MKTGVTSRTKVLVILNLALLAAMLYLLAVFQAYPVYQQTRLTDALAEIHALSPLYYAALVIIALLGISSVIWQIGGKRLQLSLLVMLALMLWITPYLLTGFTRLPDAPWHVGVAMQMPQILAGDSVAFSFYALVYPGSYIYHYAVVNIIGVDPLLYIQVYPLFCMLFFVVLCYLLLTRIFNSRVALLAMLLAIPGLHYIQLHASPHSIGAILMLTAFLLLITKGAGSKITAGVLVVIIAVSHPTTPLLIAIFLASFMLMNLIYSRRISRVHLALAALLLVCLSVWLATYYHWTSPSTPGEVAASGQVQNTFANILSRVLPSDLNTGGEYIGGTPFIFSAIYSLNKGIYYLYAAAGISALVYVMLWSFSRKKGVIDWLRRMGGIELKEAAMAGSILLLFLLTLMLAEGAHDLIETGLTYIILAISAIVASVALRSQWNSRKITLSLSAVMVLFLTLTYPVVAYSIDAYSNFPVSEKEGIKFLAENVPLNGKSLTGLSVSQVALYAHGLTSDINTDLRELPEAQPDVVALRSTYYYYRAIRFERSFTDNRYTQALAMLESGGYDKIYSSPTFSIYLKRITG